MHSQGQSTTTLAVNKLVAVNGEIINQVRNIPNQKIAKVQDKLNEFKNLKQEIENHLMIIHEQMNIIKEKININIKTLLKQSEQKYLSYLEFDYVNFENLLSTEEDNLIERIDKIKKQCMKQ